MNRPVGCLYFLPFGAVRSIKRSDIVEKENPNELLVGMRGKDGFVQKIGDAMRNAEDKVVCRAGASLHIYRSDDAR
jgi:hypothetical protein